MRPPGTGQDTVLRNKYLRRSHQQASFSVFQSGVVLFHTHARRLSFRSLPALSHAAGAVITHGKNNNHDTLPLHTRTPAHTVLFFSRTRRTLKRRIINQIPQTVPVVGHTVRHFKHTDGYSPGSPNCRVTVLRMTYRCASVKGRKCTINYCVTCSLKTDSSK